ncbi:MerR family transcriptional regulator [Lentzea cavernae]|uniref:MerR family transcriptional regulator n=1 Tax=Lentzea cavernae TaxID=2020703 RepID=A0ABQ3MGI1_9PSEU|nr:MerR family transcriptional regulator [Lentzea cavernae]GHH42711.1 MerR family transcriptional regulator [Lentzea cavernae]
MTEKDTLMRIGELSARTGASVRSLRYYEQQGLLTSTRTTGAHRLYTEAAVDRVHLLRLLYEAGLSSDTIATLLPCVDAPAEKVTVDTLDVMQRERERINTQIAAMLTTRDHLDVLIEAATGHLDRQRDAALTT